MQLVAGTCLYLAAKYEETNYPSITEMVYLCRGLYMVDDFVSAQGVVLKHSNYKFNRYEARSLAQEKSVMAPDRYKKAIDFISECCMFSEHLVLCNPRLLCDEIIYSVEHGVKRVDRHSENRVVRWLISRSVEKRLQ